LYKSSKRSHQLYYNPTTNKMVIVPVHGGKDMKKGNIISYLSYHIPLKHHWKIQDRFSFSQLGILLPGNEVFSKRLFGASKEKGWGDEIYVSFFSLFFPVSFLIS
jgi:hypothetical protein